MAFHRHDSRHHDSRVTETGFTGTADDMAARAVDSTGGFTKVLAAVKALLEHDILLDVVADR